MRTFGVISILIGTIGTLLASPTVTNPNIKVDQFGYTCSAQKIAIIAAPQTGQNPGLTSATPGTGANQYQVRRWSDDAVMYSGNLVAWNSGATQAQSGDKVWYFDFSGFTETGSYYIFDTHLNHGSYKFDIINNVYDEVMKHAVRSYYYQRCGLAKVAPYAETGWTDAASHVGALQDRNCRLYNQPNNASTEKDLSGGWYDAGDYNKYVNFVWTVMIDLMLAYDQNPTVFTDDYNIPESGNGIPDLLDEVKWEMDWLLRMQQTDGSVLCVVGGGGASPPSSDTQQRLYGPATTSATSTAAAIFALGAIEFGKIPSLSAYAATLQTAAVNAYTWAANNTNVTFSNSGVIAAGEQEVDNYGRMMRQLSAAVFLYKLTGTASYKTYVESNWPNTHLYQWWYAYPFESTEQDVLLYYSSISGATASVVNEIRNRYSNSVRTADDNFPNYTNQTDAYRANLKNDNYTWGSNKIKCNQAQMYLNLITYNMDATNDENYKNAASGYLHYMHGTNPLSLVYLSNMGNYGAENSVKEFYHSWFHDGSALWDRVGVSTYGPAPGFVPGGPNASYNYDNCCPSGCGSTQNNAGCIRPAYGQPIQKMFSEWNSSWPSNSWSVTENSCGYQASYIRLLAHFMGASGGCSLSTATKNAHNQELVTIYPNPSPSEFKLKPGTANVTGIFIVAVYDVNGVKVDLFTMDNLNNTIVFGQNLTSGIYNVVVQGEGLTQTIKVIKR
jgi:hypothetical protein